MITIADFWAMADEARLETEYRADQNLQFLSQVTPQALKEICLQYRFFTQDFPSNLGLLISKMPKGTFKTLLGEILHEELGSGHPEAAHIELYDGFLVSLGINNQALDNSIHPENAVILSEITGLVQSMPATYGVGLVGMGGECLCQIYLATMYEYLMANPYIQASKDQLNWTFWDFHVGEADIIHRQKVRQAINDLVESQPGSLPYLVNGYQTAKANWDRFWQHSFQFAMNNVVVGV